ncbi:MAG: hypothetical protein ACUVT3_09075, partial [Ignavibacterium sp.]
VGGSSKNPLENPLRGTKIGKIYNPKSSFLNCWSEVLRRILWRILSGMKIFYKFGRKEMHNNNERIWMSL